ncbi:MAG: hypothetical protein BGO70_17045 [Bacteroidetes bacterium 43-93]|nr:cytochrome-c peroxidase [Bacteroidota bacterium]OJX01459.1 MAG: hypothetical protein BGO70_17045 [Bacteroidetes bacterium 43-93]
MKSARKKSYLLILLATIGIVVSCKKTNTNNGNDGGGNSGCSVVEMKPYVWTNPSRFPLANIPSDNQFTEERIALGKQLYYDARLSNNGESCNSCHKQNMGFAGDSVSTFDNGLSKPPLVNLAWYNIFMWTGRLQGTLEDVMFAEITKRFNTDIGKINAIQDYRDKFCKYYGVSNITAQDLAKPLAQFMRVLTSSNSKYDKFVRGESGLTDYEMKGYDIFFSEKGDCFHCHAAVVLTDDMMHNNGIDSVYAKDIDKGYYNVTHSEYDLGKFKTPNLRNVALRTEFMHDGRFKTLMDVVNFYDHGVHIGVPSIDPIMTKPAKLNGGLHLTDEEKAQLIAFLNTFTDTTMTNNPFFKQ